MRRQSEARKETRMVERTARNFIFVEKFKFYLRTFVNVVSWRSDLMKSENSYFWVARRLHWRLEVEQRGRGFLPELSVNCGLDNYDENNDDNDKKLLMATTTWLPASWLGRCVGRGSGSAPRSGSSSTSPAFTRDSASPSSSWSSSGLKATWTWSFLFFITCSRRPPPCSRPSLRWTAEIDVVQQWQRQRQHYHRRLLDCQSPYCQLKIILNCRRLGIIEFFGIIQVHTFS